MIIKVAGATVGVNTDAYAAGDLLGGKLTLSGAFPTGPKEPYWINVTIQDLTKQNATIDVILFDSNPSATTFTNNAALDIADADLPKIIGFAQVSDYTSFADNSVGIATGLSIAAKPLAGADLYACLVSRGTPTYAANELSVSFGFVDGS